MEPIGEFLGLYAVVAVGYDENTQSVDVLNSHGMEFGNDGFFRMSYKYVINSELCFEIYVIATN